MTLLTPELQARIGEERVLVAPDEIGRAAIRYFALAVGDHNPNYLDEEAAVRNGYPSVVAPPTMICETNQFVPGVRDEHGYLGQMFDLDVPGTRQIRGSNSYEFIRPVVPEDRITITWRLEDITERVSSRGEPMLVATSTATYTDADGEVVARNTEKVVYLSIGR